MTDELAIPATYEGNKHIKGRKSYQLVFEIPEEAFDKFYQLFGTPLSGETKWAAIAPLNYRGADAPPERPDKRKIPLDKMSPSRQAGLLCQDKEFQAFLHNTLIYTVGDTASAKEALSRHFGIQSRKQLDENNGPNAWAEFYQQFNTWKANKKAQERYS